MYNRDEEKGLRTTDIWTLLSIQGILERFHVWSIMIYHLYQNFPPLSLCLSLKNTLKVGRKNRSRLIPQWPLIFHPNLPRQFSSKLDNPCGARIGYFSLCSRGSPHTLTGNKLPLEISESLLLPPFDREVASEQFYRISLSLSLCWTKGVGHPSRIGRYNKWERYKLMTLVETRF